MRGFSATLPWPLGADGRIVAVLLDRRGQRVLDVEKRVAVETDRDERRLHAGQHPVHASEIDVADQTAVAAALVKDLDDTTVFRQRHAGFGRRDVDEELPSHALANRR